MSQGVKVGDFVEVVGSKSASARQLKGKIGKVILAESWGVRLDIEKSCQSGGHGLNYSDIKLVTTTFIDNYPRSGSNGSVVHPTVRHNWEINGDPIPDFILDTDVRAAAKILEDSCCRALQNHQLSPKDNLYLVNMYQGLEIHFEVSKGIGSGNVDIAMWMFNPFEHNYRSKVYYGTAPQSILDYTETSNLIMIRSLGYGSYNTARSETSTHAEDFCMEANRYLDIKVVDTKPSFFGSSVEFIPLGFTIEKKEDQASRWSKEGKCPQCGEFGKFVRAAIVCSQHGTYAGC